MTHFGLMAAVRGDATSAIELNDAPLDPSTLLSSTSVSSYTAACSGQFGVVGPIEFEGEMTAQLRFRAFLSYSQSDKAFAKRLHRALETYRVPGGVHAGTFDPKTRRLGRFFRDDEEMGASPDLGSTLRGAIEDAEALIVICSKRSAKSRWVNQEVVHFKTTGRANQIFAVILDGTPDAVDPDEQCFPPALRFEVDPYGKVTDRYSEPLALDARKEKFKRLLVRLVAGLLGVPFDNLWRRESRRHQRNFAVGTAAVGVIAATLAGLAYSYVQERHAKELQALEQSRAQARVDIGEGRVSLGLARLGAYVVGPFRDRVEGDLRAVLGWSQPLAEELRKAGRPRLLSYRGSLIFRDGHGALHNLSGLDANPDRVLLAHDRKRLVLIDRLTTAVLDVTNGEILARLPNNERWWRGEAFETPGGLIAVLGASAGSTNGTIQFHLLTVSANGRSIEASYVAHFAGFAGLYIGQGCSELIVRRDSRLFGLLLDPGGPGKERGYSDFTLPKDLTQIWRAGTTLDALLPGPEKLVGRLAPKGCQPPASDSGALDFDPPLARIYSLGGENPADGSVQSVWSVSDSVPELFRRLPAPRAGLYEPGDYGGLYRGWGMGFWRAPPPPRGIPPEITDFDRVDGAQIAFLADWTNAYVPTIACRGLGPDPKCVDVSAQISESRSLETVRSPDGRFLLVPQAGTIIDLKLMERVTNMHEIATEGGSAFDFEPDKTQLALALGGAIAFYAPNSEGYWRRAEQPINAPARPPRKLDGVADLQAGYAGLIALGGGQYVLVDRGGLTTRLDSSGRKIWQIAFAGFNNVIGVQYSSNRSRAAIIGAEGLRLIDLETGLALSNVIQPPGWPTDDNALADCVNGVHVKGDGSVRVICMAPNQEPRIADFAFKPFVGALEPQLRAVLCGSDGETSPFEALKRCTGVTK